MITLPLKSGKTISVSDVEAIRGTIWEDKIQYDLVPDAVLALMGRKPTS